MSRKTVHFPRPSSGDFYNTARKRVHEYFKDKGITTHANASMVFKTIAMLCIYFVPYTLMLTGVITNTWLIFASWLIMGFGMAGIGLSVMHDANHGAYSKNKKVVRSDVSRVYYYFDDNLQNTKAISPIEISLVVVMSLSPFLLSNFHP